MIACANVANLQLARAAARGREVAIRAALGASRRRMVQQLLIEGLLLSIAGGALGVLLAVWGMEALRRLNPIELPAFVRLGIDGTALLFTMATALLTGLGFALAPALWTSKPQLTDAMKSGARGAGSAGVQQRARSTLVIAEVALAVVLLVGAGLLIRTLRELRLADPGFRPEGVVAVRISLPEGAYDDARTVQFHGVLRERLAALPGLTGAALSSHVPLGGSSSATMIALEDGEGLGASDEIRIYRHVVSPGYFAAIGAPLIQGRDFTPQDTDQGDASGVVIVSQSMARRYWPAGDAVGRRLRSGEHWYTIVGVAGEIKHRRLVNDMNADPDVYYTLTQLPSRSASLLVRSRSAAEPTVAAIRALMHELEPRTPLYEVQLLEELLAAETAPWRFTAALLGAFAAVALVLAVVGIYGVIAYSVHLRTREIGIRVAVGASPRDVVRLVLGQGLRLTVAGILAGLAGALATGRVLSSLLYGVTPSDPATYSAAALLLLAVAGLASYLPTRRATAIEPTRALRTD
jgi:predicted permease